MLEAVKKCWTRAELCQEVKSKMAKIESQMLHKMDRSLETVRSSSASEHRTVKSELETLRQQVPCNQEVLAIVSC